jgi:hypothetical protein
LSYQYINELRLMFLKQIATETPEATAALFERGDVGRPLINLMASREWMRRYGVSADWLEKFLRAALDEGQPRYDWITARRGRFDEIRAARGRLAAWIGVRYAPAWIRFRGDWSGGGAGMLVSASATAWLRIVELYRIEQEVWRAVVEATPNRITYLDPAEDKRRAERQCGWLVSWLFAGMSDGQIAKAAKVTDCKVVQERRSRFAKTIGLQRGRRERNIPV